MYALADPSVDGTKLYRCAEACSLPFIITWGQYPQVPGGLEDREDLVDNTNGWVIQEGGSHQNIVPKLAQRNVSPPCLPVDKTSFADVKLAKVPKFTSVLVHLPPAVKVG